MATNNSEKKEVVKAERQDQALQQEGQQFSVEALIARAIENNVSVDTMERMLTMRRELKAEWAKEQFDTAMAQFQAECPVIKKTKEGGATNSGKVAYRYAPLDVIDEQTRVLRGKFGFSYMIKTRMTEKTVEADCIVKHRAGHSETTTVEMPLATRTNVMSAPQQTAATITFAKRYAFINAFGIVTADEDTEAQLTPKGAAAPRRNVLTNKEVYDMTLRKIQDEGDAQQLAALKSRITKSSAYSQKQKLELLKVANDKLGSMGFDPNGNAKG